MDELSMYVTWAKDFKLSEEGVQAFQAIRKLDKIRDILMHGGDDGDVMGEIRGVVLA